MVSITRNQEADGGAESDGSSLPPGPSQKSKPIHKGSTGKTQTEVILDDEGFGPKLSGSSTCLSDASDANTNAPSELQGSDLGFYDDVLKTPELKCAQTSATAILRHRRANNLLASTPRSKAALRAWREKAPSDVKPPPETNEEHYEQLQKLTRSPWLRMMHVLHVGAKPNEVKCWEDEHSDTLTCVLKLIEEENISCGCESGNSSPPL